MPVGVSLPYALLIFVYTIHKKRKKLERSEAYAFEEIESYWRVESE